MLTTQQARFFARNGFLQLRGLLTHDACAHLVERTWKLLPSHWRRDDPTTWRGSVTDSCHDAGLDPRGGLMKFQERDLLADPHVIAAFQQPSTCHEAAHDLIGRPLRGINLRGLYAIAPLEHPESVRAVPNPHVEAHALQLIAQAYLADVAPGGGGLLVWPGSHRALYGAFDSKLEYVVGNDLKSTWAEQLRWQPVELHGARGDVLLLHHRLLHSPSINRSDRVRCAFLCDYMRLDQRTLCKQRPGDLWEDWPGLVALAGADGLAGAPDYERVRAPAEPLRRVAAANGTLAARIKGDASTIARSRRPGDVWLHLSDSPALYKHPYRLEPRGGCIAPTGFLRFARRVRVRVNGTSIRSLSRTDIIAPLPVRPGRNDVQIRGISQPLWLRMLAIDVPFEDSHVLLRRAIDGTARNVDLSFDWHPVAAAAAP